ncbi:MAG TPA: hypothetical protein VK196_20185 [Magnetospirillum sp.]|nr:hypothetical protein [Magnetospirillum sp.]
MDHSTRARRLAILTAIGLLLAGCTSEEVKTGLGGTMKAWCQQQNNCTVHDEQ